MHRNTCPARKQHTFNTLFCVDIFEVIKILFFFSIQNKDCVAYTLEEEMLSHNNHKEFHQGLDSNLKLGNVFQNLSIYNMKYIE